MIENSLARPNDIQNAQTNKYLWIVHYSVRSEDNMNKVHHKIGGVTKFHEKGQRDLCGDLSLFPYCGK